MPSVGTYVDEIPITTIQGALDVHMYDIERIEALAGPQGTLYGANSQAGTLRIITNKPDLTEFSAAYSAEVNAADHGGIGYGAEGYVNAPLSGSAAIHHRVGTARRGLHRQCRGRAALSFPASPTTIPDIAEDDYNDVDTYARGAAHRSQRQLTVTPSVMAQDQKTNGVFFYDWPWATLRHALVPRKFARSLGAGGADRRRQSPISTDRDGLFDRTVDGVLDYADYGFFYDTYLNYGNYFTSDGATPINPAQHIIARDGYSKESHELRFASPADDRFRFIAGLFYQRQEHDIYQRYLLDGLFDGHEVTTLPDTIWLTSQKRIDVDKAIFGEISYDLTDKLTATAGLRGYKSENSLEGFFGFSGAFTEFYGYNVATPAARAETPGELACGEPGFVRPPTTPDAPCTNINKLSEEDGTTHRLNLSYKIDDDRMVYATWSTGTGPAASTGAARSPPIRRTLDQLRSGMEDDAGRQRLLQCIF
jgi:outer membrane receptor protein involved in Fe transport